MSLNKFMHPRNRYKKVRPDFEALGQKYPAFKMHLVENSKGKPVLDFQNPEALRVLTICMLKEDYGFKIELPQDRLVPTLPLRLNYVHWIEDITKDWNKLELNAIDIGTGACCVYPILAISANPWRFLATETDEVNFCCAVRNLEENKLTDKIKVIKVAPDTILEGVIGQTEDTYDFCMCNPPFFADHFEAQGLVSRSFRRPDAKTMSTASPQEGIIPGGEVAFVRKMIEESNFLQEKVRVYTTMLGKKASLAPLKEIFRRYKITNFASTEFCQGKTMRWGLAWSFDKSVTFPKSLFSQGKKEGKKSVVHIIPTKVGGRREPIYNLLIFFKQIFSELKIHFREGKQTQFFAGLTITAAENTWIHSRRKRRQMIRDAAGRSKTATSETPSKTAATDLETSTTAACDVSSDTTSSSTVKELCKRAKKENDSLASSLTAQESCDGMKEEDGSVAMSTGEVDNDKDKCQVSEQTAAPSAQFNTSACVKNHKRKLETETPDSSDIPPTKQVKLDSQTSPFTSAEVSNRTDSLQTISERSEVPSVKGEIETSAIEAKESESPSVKGEVDSFNMETEENQILSAEGEMKASTSEAEGNQVPSVKERTDSSIAEACSSKCEEGVKRKDRPPAQFVLKCRMCIRVQGSDLAVELTWLGGEDIQLMHQLMQFFKNRLTQRKPS